MPSPEQQAVLVAAPPPPVPVQRPVLRTLMVTGHRPNRMGDEEWLRATLRSSVEALAPDDAVTGMAYGTDLIFAEVCVELEVPFTAVIPYPEQAHRWNREWRERWEESRRRAGRSVVLGSAYHSHSYAERNRWLVDHSTDALVVWDGDQKGGTFQTMNMLERAGREWIWVNPRRRTALRRMPSGSPRR